MYIWWYVLRLHLLCSFLLLCSQLPSFTPWIAFCLVPERNHNCFWHQHIVMVTDCDFTNAALTTDISANPGVLGICSFSPAWVCHGFLDYKGQILVYLWVLNWMEAPKCNPVSPPTRAWRQLMKNMGGSSSCSLLFWLSLKAEMIVCDKIGGLTFLQVLEQGRIGLYLGT